MARPKKIDTENTTVPALTPDPLRPGMKLVERDSHGLLKNTEYVFDDNGNVNWRKMVPVEFLYVNGDARRKDMIERKYKKSVKEIDVVVDNVEDRDLIITLAGLKHLLRLRGYLNVSFHTNESSETFASVNCYIDFLPNFETGGVAQSYSENGSAHLHSTDGFMRAYLVEAATNRAFARCIRNYLNINIVSREELFDETKTGQVGGGNAPFISNGSPQSILEKKCADAGFGFPALKAAAIKYRTDLKNNPDPWAKWNDIPAEDCYILLEMIKTKVEKSKP
jgi:hypothetical protein